MPFAVESEKELLFKHISYSFTHPLIRKEKSMSKRALLIMSFLFVFTFGGFVSDLSTLNAAQESKTEQTSKKNKKKKSKKGSKKKKSTKKSSGKRNIY